MLDEACDILTATLGLDCWLADVAADALAVQVEGSPRSWALPSFFSPGFRSRPCRVPKLLSL